MPDRLPRQLRILYELTRVVETAPYSLAEVLERICTEVRKDFGFARAVGAELVYEPAEPRGARFVLVLPEARIS